MYSFIYYVISHQVCVGGRWRVSLVQLAGELTDHGVRGAVGTQVCI